MDPILQEIMQTIYTASKEEHPNTEKLALLWKKLYLYEQQHFLLPLKRKDALYANDYWAYQMFWTHHDEIKKMPIYYEDATYDLKVTSEIVNPQDFGTEKEKLEYAIRGSIADTIRELNAKNGKDISHSSFYHDCRFASKTAARYLRDLGYDAKAVSVQDSFSPHIEHIFCIVRLGKLTYIIDTTYRQFFILPNCMEEARFHVDEPWIAPGYFIDTDEKKALMRPLLETGYFLCDDDTLQCYGDSFAMAEQSFQAKKLQFVPTKKRASAYLDAAWNAPVMK